MIVAALALSFSTPAAALDLGEQVDDDRWHLYAVEYARSERIPERRLVRGAGRARVDMSWYFFVAVGRGRVVLVDCGTDALSRPGRQALRERWSISRAVGIEEALARVGLSPREVTDIVLTHYHWDHTGALDLFRDAAVHAHRAEWRRVPARLRRPVEESGRLRALGGERHPSFPGFETLEAGHHTAHHLMVEIACPDRTVVIAGDAAYLYRNVTERLPVTVTTDRERNVEAVASAVSRVGADNVLPGHDPALFDRHPSSIQGVGVIC